MTYQQRHGRATYMRQAADFRAAEAQREVDVRRAYAEIEDARRHEERAMGMLSRPEVRDAVELYFARWFIDSGLARQLRDAREILARYGATVPQGV